MSGMSIAPRSSIAGASYAGTRGARRSLVAVHVAGGDEHQRRVDRDALVDTGRLVWCALTWDQSCLPS